MSRFQCRPHQNFGLRVMARSKFGQACLAQARVIAEK
jgi:hypothetical protein